MRRLGDNKRTHSSQALKLSGYLVALLAFVLWFITVGCGSDSPAEYSYQPPEQLADGFEVGSIDGVGSDGTWGRRGYAYTWWTHEFSHAGEKMPAYWASGFGDQSIVIFPEQEAVIVLRVATTTWSQPVPRY